MRELLHLLTDPAHWAFEAVSDIALAALVYFPARRAWSRWHTRHDDERHERVTHG